MLGQLSRRGASADQATVELTRKCQKQIGLYRCKNRFWMQPLMWCSPHAFCPRTVAPGVNRRLSPVCPPPDCGPPPTHLSSIGMMGGGSVRVHPCLLTPLNFHQGNLHFRMTAIVLEKLCNFFQDFSSDSKLRREPTHFPSIVLSFF